MGIDKQTLRYASKKIFYFAIIKERQANILHKFFAPKGKFTVLRIEDNHDYTDIYNGQVFSENDIERKELILNYTGFYFDSEGKIHFIFEGAPTIFRTGKIPQID